MIDISAVRADVTQDEIVELAAFARRNHVICAFAMPCYTPLLAQLLRDTPDVAVGGVVGFPSGAETTGTKVSAAKELAAAGCGELDMVGCVGALKSKDDSYYSNDIRSVVQAAGGIPVKAILEATCLTREEIVRGCLLAVDAGAAFVKTGTGWANSPTTVEIIRLIKETVGNRAGIKAAGGIRDLATVREMTRAGCTRFGIGIQSARKILEETSAMGWSPAAIGCSEVGCSGNDRTGNDCATRTMESVESGAKNW
jgi:deoxyribose-phosphate aldolase